MYRMATIISKIILHIWKLLRVNLGKVLKTKKYNFVQWQTVILTSCNHFTMYTNIKSLCCIKETNVMLYINYILKCKQNTASFKPSCLHFTYARLSHFFKTYKKVFLPLIHLSNFYFSQLKLYIQNTSHHF